MQHRRRDFDPGYFRAMVLGDSIPCTSLVNSLRDSAPYIAVIGDASKVSTITNAVYEGYHAALDI